MISGPRSRNRHFSYIFEYSGRTVPKTLTTNCAVMVAKFAIKVNDYEIHGTNDSSCQNFGQINAAPIDRHS